MKRITKSLALIAVVTATAVASAAASKMVCTLTGKEVKTCCCEKQTDGKLLCKLTGKTLDKCCCTGM